MLLVITIGYQLYSFENLQLQDVPVENKETDAAKIEVKDEKDQNLTEEENKEEAKT